MANVIYYVHRSTLNMTDLKTTHKSKDRSRLYRMIYIDENELATWPQNMDNNRSLTPVGTLASKPEPAQ